MGTDVKIWQNTATGYTQVTFVDAYGGMHLADNGGYHFTNIAPEVVESAARGRALARGAMPASRPMASPVAPGHAVPARRQAIVMSARVSRPSGGTAPLSEAGYIALKGASRSGWVGRGSAGVPGNGTVATLKSLAKDDRLRLEIDTVGARKVIRGGWITEQGRRALAEYDARNGQYIPGGPTARKSPHSDHLAGA